ncbi:MAG TPA: hypothetical protein VE467_13640 [Chryseolinea sp.]|nr:hypothetical protein [Chryseolinea sp.]
MYKYLILSMLISMSMTVYGQDTSKCDTNTLEEIEDKIGMLPQAKISEFLVNIGKCRNNVEYRKKSNQLLFEILDKQTQTTVNAMQQERSKLDMEAIANAISSFQVVFTEIDALIDKVKQTKCDEEIRVILLDHLMLAKANVKKG